MDNRYGKRAKYDAKSWWKVAKRKVIDARRCLNCKQPVGNPITSHHPPKCSWTCENVLVNNDSELTRHLN